MGRVSGRGRRLRGRGGKKSREKEGSEEGSVGKAPEEGKGEVGENREEASGRGRLGGGLQKQRRETGESKAQPGPTGTEREREERVGIRGARSGAGVARLALAHVEVKGGKAASTAGSREGQKEKVQRGEGTAFREWGKEDQTRGVEASLSPGLLDLVATPGPPRPQRE